MMIELYMMMLETALLHHGNDELAVVLFQLLLDYCRRNVFRLQLKSVLDVVCEYRTLEQLAVSLEIVCNQSKIPSTVIVFFNLPRS